MCYTFGRLKWFGPQVFRAAVGLPPETHMALERRLKVGIILHPFCPGFGLT
jgi:hypothetical protein